MKTRILTGQRFGRLVVVERCDNQSNNRYKLLCQCDCGKTALVAPGDLKRKDARATKSCGCLMIEKLIKRRFKHGMKGTRTYQTWKSFRARCYNKTRADYRFYGARGITVCKRWENSFENFFADMGEKPIGMTLDRIDNGGPYSPDNCRWATWETQFHNRPNLPNKKQCVFLAHNGEIHSVSAWGRITGLGKALSSRLNRGWSIEKALTTPKQNVRIVSHS